MLLPSGCLSRTVAPDPLVCPHPAKPLPLQVCAVWAWGSWAWRAFTLPPGQDPVYHSQTRFFKSSLCLGLNNWEKSVLISSFSLLHCMWYFTTLMDKALFLNCISMVLLYRKITLLWLLMECRKKGELVTHLQFTLDSRSFRTLTCHYWNIVACY